MYAFTLHAVLINIAAYNRLVAFECSGLDRHGEGYHELSREHDTCHVGLICGRKGGDREALTMVKLVACLLYANLC